MKFTVSNRRAGKFNKQEKEASRNALEIATVSFAGSSSIIADLKPENALARRTLIMDGTEADMLRMNTESAEDVIVEPLIEHWIDNTALGAFSRMKIHRTDSGFPTGVGNTVTVSARGDGKGLRHATVFLVVRALNGEVTVLEDETGGSGDVTFDLSPLFQPILAVVLPYANFWSSRAPVTLNQTSLVQCRKISQNQRIDWWHRQTGLTTFNPNDGNGIRVGVIDTGFGPHNHMTGVDEGAFIDNMFDPAGGADADKHGSHVCGTISGNPGAELRRCGVAPGVSLHSCRVFPPGGNASNVDIANAIDFLSREKECDLINMSLGAPVGSAIMQDAIQDALERGTLCICAAANTFGPVGFPAAFPEAVAISACGRMGEAPPESASGRKEPEDPNLFGMDQLFFANFSCFGPEIDAIAPGVGIIATVPERHGFSGPYAALDGTSMASPVATGTLARALAKQPDYQAMPRNIHRADMARAILEQLCSTIGLAADFEGEGLVVE